MNAPLLTDGTVRLRALEPEDLELLYRWENEAALWAVSDTTAPYSREVLRHYLAEYAGDIFRSRQLRLMVTLPGGTAVGTVDFFNFDPMNNRAELGLYIAPEHCGRGHGKAALSLACGYAAGHVGMRQVYAYVRTDNAAALATFEGCGFSRSGVLRAWVKRGRQYHDVAVLQLMLA